MSTYSATITWRPDSPETFEKNRYTRGHSWEFDGGVTVPASSSPHVVKVPFSIEEAVDPEEALVASASSCHMLSFLYLAATAGFNLASYTDAAVGEMAKLDDGNEWMSTITLDPQIEWIGDKRPSTDEIKELHQKAHKICYIANSLKTEIIIKG